MNKKLLVAAVGAAMMSVGVAQAQVTVYGHAHVSIDNLDQDKAADVGEWFVSNNSTRLGVRASEDIGGGMKAEAQYELLFVPGATGSPDGFEVTTGTVATNRDNFIGLSGGFGALRLGVIDSATKDVGGIADLFYREQLGEGRAITNQGFWDGRIGNAIHYVSPSMGGWTVKVQYGVEDDYATDATTLAANVRGKVGPVDIGVGYMKQELSATTDTSGFRVGAKLTMGAIAVTGLWQTQKDIGGISGRDRDSYGAGASFTMGKNVLKAQWYKAKARDDLAISDGGDQVSVGWDYNFSKTTRVYATYAKTSNDAAGTFGIGGNGHGQTATPNAGGDAKGFSLGMIKDF